MESQALQPRGSVVDIFCGAGGQTHGFWLEGFSIAAGIDLDEGCRYAFERNNGAPFVRKDVGALSPEELDDLFYKGEPKILVGCAPCQPFSLYNQGSDDPEWQLVGRFAELICATLPDVVSMENVPRLLDFKDGAVFEAFTAALLGAGYSVSHQVVFAPDYGVPQRRLRLVLLGSRHGAIELDGPTLSPDAYPTVADAIGFLPALAAGGIDQNDSLHRASRMSDRNMERIRSSKPGGSWKDWAGDLVADCHKVKTGRGYASVYGRMRADES